MTTAFVLSGGGSLGCVQVGMLQALAERDVQPDLLVGASVGAMNAAFVAGRGLDTASLRALADVWCGMHRHDVFPFQPARQLQALIGTRDSLCTDSGMRRLLDLHLPFELLEEATIPLHVVATDLASGLDMVLSEGDAASAILASAAIPAVFPPVEIDGRTLVDGGIANNTPISHAVALGANRVVVLPSGAPCALAEPPHTAIGVALQSLGLLIAQRLSLDIAAWRGEVELVVLPPLCPVSVSLLDFGQAPSLLARARDATHAWLASGDSLDRPGVLAPHRHPELGL